MLPVRLEVAAKLPFLCCITNGIAVEVERCGRERGHLTWEKALEDPGLMRLL